MKPKSTLLLASIGYLSFAGLGLRGSMLAVAWPSIRASFGLSLDAVGVLMIATAASSLVSSATSGPVVSRIGIGRLLTASSLAAVVGLLGLALAPAWWAMVLFGLIAGAGGGAVDAGLNTYFADNYGPRPMNWLHASFGLGSTLGPTLMTIVLNSGQSWRWGYAIAGLLQALLAFCFGFSVERWQGPKGLSTEAEARPPAGTAGAAATLRLPTVWLSVLLFFMLSGVEIGAGQWAYSLFTEARSVAPATAGLWTGIYWGSLTASRVAYGIAGDRFRILPSLRVGMLGTICGAALVWWNATDTLSFLGLALMGLAFAPLFPLLQLITPKRVGPKHLANTVGFQVAAAWLGMSGLPGLACVLAESRGLEIIGPFLLVGAIVMLLVHEALVLQEGPRDERGTGH